MPNSAASAGLLSHILSYTCNLESCLLDGLAERLEVRLTTAILTGSAVHLFQRIFHYAGTGDADIDNGVALADSMEGTGHERVVVRSIAEDHELGRTDAQTVSTGFGSLAHDLAHEFHGVHV